MNRQFVGGERAKGARTQSPGTMRSPYPVRQKSPASAAAEAEARQVASGMTAAGGGTPETFTAVSQPVARGPAGRGGQPIPASQRRWMEGCIGHDFSSVRIHTDADAAHLSRFHRAKAFALGENVYFAARRYAPDTVEGRGLLAHELVHVVQQRLAGPGAPPMLARDSGPAPMSADRRAAIFDGKVKSEADYGKFESSPIFKFSNATLQEAFDYVSTKYHLDAKLPITADSKPAGGDSLGKDPDDVPPWVGKLTQQLVDTLPNAQGPGPDPFNKVKAGDPKAAHWDEDSTLAQCVLDAFYHGWAEKHRDSAQGGAAGAELPGNVEELFRRIGSSKTNKRAQLLGESPQAIYGWCGPASQYAVVISLMRKGLRFKTGKPPEEPKKLSTHGLKLVEEKDKMSKEQNQRVREALARIEKANKWLAAWAVLLEIGKQGAYFLATWPNGQGGSTSKGAKQKGDAKQPARIVGGKEARTALLLPGDYLTIVTAVSPLSGHVATVIREESEIAPADWAKAEAGDVLSRIYMVSGNARNSAVRVEVVKREMPPPDYDWGALSAIGNRFTELRQVETDKMAELNKGSGGGNLQQKLLTRLNSDPTKFKAAVRAVPSGWIPFVLGNWGSQAKILELMDIAGMQADMQAYKDSFNSAAFKDVQTARAAKEAYKDKYAQQGIPVDNRDPNYGAMNRSANAASPRKDGKPVGKVKPLDPSNAWVVTVVRSSQLDANRIDTELKQIASTAGGPTDSEQEQQKLLNQYGLEKIPAEWMAKFREGLEFWEPRGGGIH